MTAETARIKYCQVHIYLLMCICENVHSTLCCPHREDVQNVPLALILRTPSIDMHRRDSYPFDNQWMTILHRGRMNACMHVLTNRVALFQSLSRSFKIKMSTASVERAATDSTMFKSILDRFHVECDESLRSELNTRLLASSLSAMDKTASIYYLTEYQRCVDEQNGFDSYIREQIASLEALKSCEIAIDTFLERLKAIHDYEWKQNEVFEQILHELTKLVRFQDRGESESFIQMRWFRIHRARKNVYNWSDKSMNWLLRRRNWPAMLTSRNPRSIH